MMGIYNRHGDGDVLIRVPDDKDMYNRRGDVLIRVPSDKLRDLNLSGADLGAAHLEGANLNNAVLNGANLSGADLGGAHLGGAHLRGANLSKAYLGGAHLGGADLGGANLSGANLMGADLGAAHLEGANLDGADLRGAHLRGAHLGCVKLTESTRMPSGGSWREYVTLVVPQLLEAGGKTVAEVLATGCWECHSWENCPMHVALGISSIDEAPALLAPRVREFVQLFDARLIPRPNVSR